MQCSSACSSPCSTHFKLAFDNDSLSVRSPAVKFNNLRNIYGSEFHMVKLTGHRTLKPVKMIFKVENNRKSRNFHKKICRGVLTLLNISHL